MYFEEVKKNFGFGCMRLPMNGDQVDNEETCKRVDYFIENGFNYFDTAHGYLEGKSEIAVKDCLTSRYLRESYVLAVTAESCSFPKRELNAAIAFCEKEGIRHVVCHSEELEIDGFAQNPPNRCYLCKHELFEKIGSLAKENGIEYVAEGSNMDDNGDYRPGLQAVAFKHTTTLGVREYFCRRYGMHRSVETVQTEYGDVRVKHASGYGSERRKAEYEDLARIARETGKSLEEIRGEIEV